MQRLLRLLVAVMVISSTARAQCGTGYTQAALNWDALEFLRTTGTYNGYVSSTMASTQKFGFGSEYVTITHNYATSTNNGVNGTNTGETGSFGSGDDVQFTGNGTITFTFASAVQNVKFSLYDIDVSQRVTFGASNSLGVAQTISLATLGGSSSVLTVSNNNATNARVDASATAVGNTSVNGTVNVTIAGPITSFTITVTNTGTVTNGPASGQESGAFWLSDVAACTTAAAFTTSYYSVAKPWTGQPGYVLVVANNKIYYVDPATGKGKFLFQDPAQSNINSLAYDPVNRVVYYTYSLTSSSSTDKTVKKYDVTTSTISTYISDVTTLGIPTYQSGVESGAAAFYDGKLYLGVEGYMATGTTGGGRKSCVWRIESTNGTPSSAVQVYGVMSDGGTSAGSGNTHDWSDIGVNDGVLYDFDGSINGENTYVYNLFTGALSVYTPGSTFDPHQVAVDWSGTMYNVDSTITPYNGTNAVTVASRKSIVGTPAISVGSSWGDAAEAFKPMGDLGDAPASYDPVANSPAVHEVSSNLRLGASVSYEWTKNTSALATGDADDGMPTPSIVISNSNYITSVNVYNNTGANATVCAWVDFNNNGLFDATEGISVNVPTSTSTQTVQLFWPTPTTTLLPYSYTFIRIRVTSASNGMTTSNATGFYSDGEVEDYRVQVNAYTLPSNLLSFDARKEGPRAQLHWEVSDEVPGTVYRLERSPDGSAAWEELQRLQTSGAVPRRGYNAFDDRPFPGQSYYRLQVRKPGGATVWSPVRVLRWNGEAAFTLSPNPSNGTVQLDIDVPAEGLGTIRIYTGTGGLVLQQDFRLPAGPSSHPLTLPGLLPPGTYLVELQTGCQRRYQRLLLRR